MNHGTEFVILDLATMTIEVEDKFNDFDFELFATDDGQKLMPVWYQDEDPPLVHVEYSENGWWMFFTKPAFARYRDFFGELDRIGRCSRWDTKYSYEAQDAVPGFYISALVSMVVINEREFRVYMATLVVMQFVLIGLTGGIKIMLISIAGVASMFGIPFIVAKAFVRLFPTPPPLPPLATDVPEP